MADRIPQSFIDELLARIDIVEVIERRVPLKKAGKDYAACCPFHDEKTPSFTVVPTKQFYHCFGCGVSGSAITFLMEYDRLSFPEAIEELAGQAGLEVPQTTAPAGEESNLNPLVEELQGANRYYQQQLRHHDRADMAVDYLKSRGVSGKIAGHFQLGFAPPGWESLTQTAGSDNKRLAAMERAGLLGKRDGGGYYDRLRERVTFPIHDQRGRVIGFGGRILGDGEPKYLNSPESPLFHKGAELYGLYQARHAIRDAGKSVVVEGYMDVIALAEAGIENVVATLGTATTREHLRRLFRQAPEIIFCFDGDRAGRAAAWKALELCLPEMSRGRQVGFLFLPEGDDPDTLVRREGVDGMRQLLDHARPLPDVLFERLREQVDMTRLDGRARMVELAMPLIDSLPAGALQDLMAQRLQQETGVSSLPKGHGETTAPTSGREKSERRSSATGKMSLVATAISLLLQHPRLAERFEAYPKLDGLDQRGMDMLMSLRRMAEDQPGITTAAMVERYRGDDAHRHLENLASRDHKVEDEDLDAYFEDTLSRLDEKRIRQAINALDQMTAGSPQKATRMKDLIEELNQRQNARHNGV